MALDFKTIISKKNLFLPDLVEQVLNKYRPANGNCLTIGKMFDIHYNSTLVYYV